MGRYKIQIKIPNYVFNNTAAEMPFKEGEHLEHDSLISAISNGNYEFTHFEKTNEKWYPEKIDTEDARPAIFIEINLFLLDAKDGAAILEEILSLIKVANSVEYFYGAGHERHLSYQHIDDDDIYLDQH